MADCQHHHLGSEDGPHAEPSTRQPSAVAADCEDVCELVPAHASVTSTQYDKKQNMRGNVSPDDEACSLSARTCVSPDMRHDTSISGDTQDSVSVAGPTRLRAPLAEVRAPLVGPDVSWVSDPSWSILMSMMRRASRDHKVIVLRAYLKRMGKRSIEERFTATAVVNQLVEQKVISDVDSVGLLEQLDTAPTSQARSIRERVCPL